MDHATSIDLGGFAQFFREFGWPGVAALASYFAFKFIGKALITIFERYSAVQEKRVVEAQASTEALNKTASALIELKQMIERAIITKSATHTEP